MTDGKQSKDIEQHNLIRITTVTTDCMIDRGYDDKRFELANAFVFGVIFATDTKKEMSDEFCKLLGKASIDAFECYERSFIKAREFVESIEQMKDKE